MRSRPLLVTCCLASLFGLAQAQAPKIPFKSRELQEGKNFVQSQTTPLTVGESSGQVSTTVAVSVPPGRGITPTVELQYSSSAGLSEYGYGWDLTIPLIERSNRSGAPRYDFGRDKFHFRNGQQVAELEFVQVEPSGWSLFRERTDHSFNRCPPTEDLTVRFSSWQVTAPTYVKDLLEPNMGLCIWGACR